MTRFTLVSYHAHPDDEALLTGGTLARAAAEGHRVVVAVATDGESGLDGTGADGPDLGRRRRGELERSAAILGVARVVRFGHRDSGWSPSGTLRPRDDEDPSFAALDPDGPAQELAALLREEGADALTTYDASGGYGHPDHVQVHRVGAAAARLAGTPVVLEATVDRRAMERAVGLLRRMERYLPVPELPDPTTSFVDRSEITHVVDVRAQVGVKKRALSVHASQRGVGRTVSLLSHLPPGLDRAVLGREWFREVGRLPGDPLDDIFASLRSEQPVGERRG